MATTIPVQRNSQADPTDFFHQTTNPRLASMLDQWQRGKLWHDAAPKQLRDGWSALDTSATWERWTTYLRDRKSEPLVDTLGTKAEPLDWGLPTDDASLASVALWRADLDRLVRSTASPVAATKLEAMLAEVVHAFDHAPLMPAVALQAVAVAYRLAELAQHLSATVWWRVLAGLVDLATESSITTTDDLAPDTTLAGTLVAGELPLVLSLVLPELKPTRTLRSLARKSLGEGLLAATDGEGMIDGQLLPALPMLFASWTRARAMGEELKKGCWSGAAETQYEWLVRQTIRLQRTDGSPMLSTAAHMAWPAGALDVALDLAGDEQDDTAAAARLPKLLPTIDHAYHEYDLPEASAESEWSSLAVLANGWDKSSSRVLVDYSQPQMGVEIESRGRTLISGTWETETFFDDQRLEPIDEWEQQCWYSDDECDFLDLVIELAGGARLERQIFLGKDDAFFFAHDILHGADGRTGQWRHASRLPLLGGMQFVGEPETRDGTLVSGKGSARASVLPLALAEWRVEPRFGELTMVDQTLQLAQTARGARLSCPLWFDLDPRRVSRARTWRRLTVAASLEVAPSDVAVGYRVQCGDAQWLLYRSLAQPANRTVLGQNTAAEMFVARFYRTGECDELLAIDPA